MNRNELKSIVKECLVEILMEGVAPAAERVSESRIPKRLPVPSPVPTRKSPLDSVTYSPSRASAPKPPPPRAPQKEQYRELANGNDVMASIFADTAGSTLLEQREGPGGSGMSQHAAANPVIDTGVDPNLMEGSNNWALLAFSDGPRKSPMR